MTKALTTSGPTPYFSHRTAHRARLPNTISRLYDNSAWASAKAVLDFFDSLTLTSFTQRTSVHSQTQFCWLKEHPINLPWLLMPLADTLRTLLTPTMVDIQQQTDLQIATECHPTTIQRKQDLPVRMPAPSCIPDWPQHLLPRRGDFETTTARTSCSELISPQSTGKQQSSMQ